MFMVIFSAHNVNSRSLSGIVAKGWKSRPLLTGHKIRVMLMVRMYLIDGELNVKDNPQKGEKENEKDCA